jgi:type II secretory pathway pseudopilin PulG
MLAVEMILIVVSILLAFSLESWRADRDSQARQEALRQSVQADFAATRTYLAQLIGAGDTLVARTERLLESLREPGSAGADSLQVLFAEVLRPVGRVPLPPSYRAAMATGEFRILDYPGLMSALAVLEFMDQMVATHLQVSADIFYTGPQAQLATRLGGSGALMGSDDLPARFVPSDYIAMVSAPDVYAATERMLIVNRNMLGGLKQMESAMADVVQILSDRNP